MKLLFLLSGESTSLAREEILALAGKRKCEQAGKILIINSEEFDFSRLAYTKKVYKFIFSCKGGDLLKYMKKTDWSSFYRENFCIRIVGTNILKEKELASFVWNSVKNPKVNLSDPATQFEFLFFNGKVYCGLLIAETGQGFTERKSNRRPTFHPSSMNAKLARAIVNLTAVNPKERLLDPFCGCGGILIEGGIIGAKAVGIDIDPLMISKAQKNFDFYKIKGYELKVADSTLVNMPKVDAIATDPPYGRSSSLHNKDINSLYYSFLDNAFNNLLKKGKRLCIIFPSTIKLKSKFKKVCHIDLYVHKSLTRRIFVLEK